MARGQGTQRVAAPTSRVPSPASATATQTVAERLGAYRLIEQIGEGGMGVVHLAVDRRGRAVAIKVLRSHVAIDDDARHRLGREVATLSLIRDDRVAPVIDADVHGPRPYIVTRYVPGPALDDVVRDEGPLPPDELLALARGMAEAIRAIHACGVVHRDIKPGNVLLEDGDPVLIDFGIAHLQDDVRHTVGGLVMGTPGYLSPELVEGAAITDATDWWGWAATITYAASGRPPFGSGRMEGVLARVRAGEVDLDGVEPRLAPLLRAALAPDPRRRPHADDVLRALEQFARGERIELSDTADGVWDDPGRHGADTRRLDAPGSTRVMPPVAPTRASPTRDTPPRPYRPDAVERPTRAARSARHTSAARSTSAAGHASAGGQASAAGHAAMPGAPVAPGPTGSPGAPVPSWAHDRSMVPERAGDDRYPHEQDDAAETYRTGGIELSGGPRAAGHATGALAAGAALAWAAMAGHRPGIAVILLLAWSLVARATCLSVNALVLRRYLRGRRRSDIPWGVIMSPVHLLRAAVSTVLAALLPALVALAVMFMTALGWSTLSGTPMRPGGPVPLMAGALAALGALWWGPGSHAFRSGGRVLGRRLTPRGTPGYLVSGALAVAAVVLAVMAASADEQALWWPWAGSLFGG